MRFVAIDFETANHRADSACQLAAVVVEDGEILAEHNWLIRPPQMYFSPRNIAIHGIKPNDVRHAPTMEAVWQEFEGIIANQVLIAHNARFDLGVLVHSLAAFEIAAPDLEFQCTRALARAAWPGRAKYGLKPLGEWLGISFRHHDALEDARCCATIALAAADVAKAVDLDALESNLAVKRGNVRQGKITSPRSLRGRRSDSSEAWGRTQADRWGFPLKSATTASGVDANAVVTAAASQLPLAGRRIFFAGPLRGLSYDETIQLALKLGATCHPDITMETQYVVACGCTLEEASDLAVAHWHQTAQPNPRPTYPSVVCGF